MNTNNILLVEPSLDLAQLFLDKVDVSQSLHHPWSYPPKTMAEFEQYIGKMHQANQFGFFLCQKDSLELVGVVNINEVVFGGFQSGYLGYYMFKGYEQQGYMFEGLNLVIKHAFTNLKLHRLEANIQPENIASIKLIEKLNFRKEGFSEKYLKINGNWCDHVRYAKVNHETT